MPPSEIADLAEQLGIPSAMTDDIESALEFGLAGLDPDAALLVTGSVFVVGAARVVLSGRNRAE
jgi:hypothetical protein